MVVPDRRRRPPPHRARRSTVRALLLGAVLAGGCDAARPGAVAPADPAPAVQDDGDSSAPTCPTTDERAAERGLMVERTIAARGVRDPRVLEAMRAVPRHWFVPAAQRPLAYADHPLPIGHDQTISQPYIVALMTEAVDVAPGERVLEVGTGSGYQAAVLACLTPHVWSIEIVTPLAERAAADLAARGYGTVTVRAGDGYRGWPEHAPFDAIVVTAAPDHVPPALVEQLAPGGRMCIPVGGESGLQRLLLIVKDENGDAHEETILPVRFVPMTGEARER